MSDIAALVADNLDLWTSAIERKSSAGRGSSKKINLYGIKRLRALILDLAIRGKLVPQSSEDEPADEVLKRTTVQRTKLQREGQIGKARKVSPLKGPKPFESPDGWAWTQLSEIGHDWGQEAPASRFTYVDVGAIDQNFGVVREPSILEANVAPSRARKRVRKGTVIYSTVRPYLLNIAVIEEDFDPAPIASTAFAVIHPFEGIEASFLYRYLRSPLFVSYVESVQTGIAYPAINDKQFYSAWFPLPPLAEQKRIVAKVDELMALCDALERESEDALAAHQALVENLLATLTTSTNAADLAKNWARLETHFDTLFTTQPSIDVLKQTILDLAVRGKLVEQDPDDEPAESMLAPTRSNTDHKPPGDLNLPGGWVSSPLGRMIDGMDSGWSPACHPFPAQDEEKWGVLKTTAVQILAYQQDENKELPDKLEPRQGAEVRAGDILITRAGPTNRVGICCYVPDTRSRLMISDKIIRFRPITDKMSGSFLALSLTAGPAALQLEAAKSGMAASQVNISQTKLKNTCVMLPPSTEQKRIVAKVDELMALCEQLKSCLADAAQTQRHLADAVTQQAAA